MGIFAMCCKKKAPSLEKKQHKGRHHTSEGQERAKKMGRERESERKKTRAPYTNPLAKRRTPTNAVAPVDFPPKLVLPPSFIAAVVCYLGFKYQICHKDQLSHQGCHRPDMSLHISTLTGT